jgi:hypothetical protein
LRSRRAGLRIGKNHRSCASVSELRSSQRIYDYV